MLLHDTTSTERSADPPSSRGGFTLIELLVALLLLDVGLLALVGFATALYRDGDDTRATARAWSIAAARVERMASMSCGAAGSGTATSAGGVSEWFTETTTPNETQGLTDSVRVVTSRGVRIAALHTSARC